MASLFDKLPFTQAIDALRERLAIPKADFLELDAANRSRAFTMAYVRDQSILEAVHDELSQAIAEGKTYAEFEKALKENHLRGWAGTGSVHQRLVYETNLGMAYSAGRVQQAQESGITAWRYLASISDHPRVDHEQYYGNIYRFAPGSPVPPIDFNCTCGWEIVFPHELAAMGIDPASLPIFNPPVPRSGFVWSPSDYFDTSRTVSVNRELMSRQSPVAGFQLVICAAVDRVSSALPTWVEAASKAVEEIAANQLHDVLEWLAAKQQSMTLTAIRDAIADPTARLARQLLSRMADPNAVELDHQATLAALLEGREAIYREIDRKQVEKIGWINPDAPSRNITERLARLKSRRAESEN